MYWGYSLLGWTDKIGDAFATGVFEVRMTIFRVFYLLWTLIARIVSGVESIFRNLAGLGEKGDIVNDIIMNTQVQAIFNNLVGFSMAIIIFFTIVKIIQDHYKEKDGGNPYKICIRTFKGLLMFFFVTSAVAVGLNLSTVVFKALDSATGSGSVSIAGTVFKAMAAEGNRKKIGRLGDSNAYSVPYNKYWERANNASTTEGRYFMASFNDAKSNKASTQAELKQRYAERFPATQWGILQDDGTVVPLMSYGADLLGTSGLENQMEDPTKYSNEDGSMEASAGYSNDFLMGIDVSVTPSIDLTWSPVDIEVIQYALRQDGDRLEHNIQILVHGYGALIPMSTQMQKFTYQGTNKKSLEDSAKVFGINMHGGASLQGGEASASFGLDMGTLFSDKFSDLMQCLLVNVFYTNAFNQIVQIIPAFPGATSIGPVSISYVQIVSPMLVNILGNSVNAAFSKLIPVDDEGNLAMEPFSNGASDHNGAIWVTMNTKSNTLDTDIERYRIDGNFTDLWGQLMSNIEQLKAQLEESNESAFVAADEGIDDMNSKTKDIEAQRPWQSYMGTVNDYNERASKDLQKLGNLLALSDATHEGTDANACKDRGWTGSNLDLKEAISETFTGLVSLYNSEINGAKPVNSYAAADIVPGIYKPIIEFGITEKLAQSMSIAQIKETLAAEGTKINLYYDTSKNAAYRVIDWECYGPMYRDSPVLGDVADMYYDGSLPKDASASVLKNKSGSLKFFGLEIETDKNGNTPWDRNGGVVNLTAYMDGENYKVNNIGVNNGTAAFLKENSYWAADGVHVDGYEPVYFYYEGTTFMPGHKSTGYNQEVNGSSVYASRALSNESLATSKAQSQKMIDSLLTVNTESKTAKEFSKDIVTFTRLNPTGDEKQDNAKAKTDWINSKSILKPNGTPSEPLRMLHTMSAEDIDNYFASTNRGVTRRYLLMTTEGSAYDAADDASNWGDYVGVMSWESTAAINALYSFDEINYAIGFICIITAAGVYLNFAFGLIQRAVNMAVLYMLSPITIAFYPFDDGSKFNNVFVKPFYNEAIGAYAIIVSLNLFIVLMSPVQTAVTKVLGSNSSQWNTGAAGMANSLISWLPLVAFVSMLPQIRNMVYSVLGGSKMAEKSLADVWKDANNSTVGKAFHKAAKGAEATHKWNQGRKATAQAKKDEYLAGLQDRKDSGESLTKFEQRMLNSAAKKKAKQENKEAKLAEKQAKKDKAINEVKSLRDAAAEAKAKGDMDKYNELTRQADAAHSKLGFFDKKRYDKISAEASKRAKNMVNRKDFKTDAEYNAALDAKTSQLMDDQNVRKSVNGTVLRKGAKAVGHKAAAAGRYMKYRVGNSIVGEALHDYFGPNGKLASDKNSIIGTALRMRNPAANAKIRKERSEQFVREQNERWAALKDTAKSAKEISEATKSLEEALDVSAQAAGAQKTLDKKRAAGQINDEEALTRMKMTKYLQQGKKADEARQLAELEIEKEVKKNSKKYASRKDAVKALYEAEGGDAKFAAGIAKGFKEYGIDMDLNDVDVTSAITARKEELRNMDSAALTAEITKIQGEKTKSINVSAANMAEGLGKKGDKATIDAIAKVFAAADVDTSQEDMASKISSALNIDMAEVQDKLGGVYSGVSQAVQYDVQVENLQKLVKANQSYTSAMKTWDDNIGDGVSSAAKAQMIEAIRQNFNSDLNSTDPNSVGYQKRQIILSYQAQGISMNDPRCQAELEKLHIQAQARMTTQLTDFIRQNEDAIRVHKDAKELREGVRSLFSNQAFDAVMEGYDKVQSQISRYASDTLVKDGKLQQMEDAGNLAGAGNLKMELINAIRSHDYDTAYSLGFDTKTVDYFKSLEVDGDPRGDLDKVYAEASYAASYMGGVSADMGGNTLEGAARAAGMLWSIGVKTKRNEKFQILKQDAAQKEQSARNYITLMRAKVANTFNDKNWDMLKGQIQDAAGDIVNDSAGVIKALEWTIDQLNNNPDSKNSGAVKANLDLLSNLKSDWIKDPAMKLMVDQADVVLGCIEQAVVADQASRDTDAVSQMIGRNEFSLQDLANKIAKPVKGL